MQKTQEMWVQSLGREDSLEEGMAIVLPGDPMDKGAWWAHGVGTESDMTEVT